MFWRAIDLKAMALLSSNGTRSVSFWIVGEHFLQLKLPYLITIFCSVLFFTRCVKFSAQCCLLKLIKKCVSAHLLTMLIYAFLLAPREKLHFETSFLSPSSQFSNICIY